MREGTLNGKAQPFLTTGGEAVAKERLKNVTIPGIPIFHRVKPPVISSPNSTDRYHPEHAKSVRPAATGRNFFARPILRVALKASPHT